MSENPKTAAQVRANEVVMQRAVAQYIESAQLRKWAMEKALEAPFNSPENLLGIANTILNFITGKKNASEIK